MAIVKKQKIVPLKELQEKAKQFLRKTLRLLERAHESAAKSKLRF